MIDGLALKIKSTGNFRLILMNYTELLPLPVRTFSDVVRPLTRIEIGRTLRCAHLRSFGDGPTVKEYKKYMKTYLSRLEEYKRMRPEHAESHLLIHHAAADVVEEMQ